MVLKKKYNNKIKGCLKLIDKKKMLFNRYEQNFNLGAQ